MLPGLLGTAVTADHQRTIKEEGAYFPKFFIGILTYYPGKPLDFSAQNTNSMDSYQLKRGTQ